MLAAGSVVLVPVILFMLAAAYCMWLHKRGVAEPEKAVADLLKVLLPTRRAINGPTAEREAEKAPPAA
ncbi:hypothetical protein UB45_05030 [Terrabacter sp. 28]|nr:hypothetical protein UB45_05030 [Terrabacter sp. 28]